MSVQIERAPSVAPIREIRATCNLDRRDSVTFVISDGELEIRIEQRWSDASTSVELSREDTDTLLQALAEIRGDLATRPF
jgi:hypothetical protein